jgi:hypothetical protein
VPAEPDGQQTLLLTVFGRTGTAVVYGRPNGRRVAGSRPRRRVDRAQTCGEYGRMGWRRAAWYTVDGVTYLHLAGREIKLTEGVRLRHRDWHVWQQLSVEIPGSAPVRVGYWPNSLLLRLTDFTYDYLYAIEDDFGTALADRFGGVEEYT